MRNPILIGEIGLSHEGSLGIAMSMVKKAKEIGLNAVKFQMHFTEFESTKDEKFRVKVFPQDESRLEYWRRTSFTLEEWRSLYNYCEEIDIVFLCTPFSKEAARFLKMIGVDSVKIASGDFDNEELVEYALENFSTIFMSTGFAFLGEIEEKHKLFLGREFGKLYFLQCTSKYPTPLTEVGMQIFAWFQSKGINYGLSDHTGNKHVVMMAICGGASAIEFHLVYSKDQFGPDSKSSLTFEEAAEVVEFKKVFCEVYDESYSKDRMARELSSVRELFGRGLALKNGKSKGEVIHREDLVLKKPSGPHKWHEVQDFVGKKLQRDISAYEHILIEDIE